jgi:GntR family transcriptional regulator
VTLHRDLADALRRQILDGELPLGASLPSEARLCESWSASRGTVRQALATLRAEGLIGGGRGTPPIVRSRQLAQPFDTMLSFTRWAALIGKAAGQKVIELSRRPASGEVADALGIDEGDTVVELLRLRSLDGEPVMLERAHFPFRIGLPLLSADLDASSVYATLIGSGVDISDAHHTFDAVGADDVDASLLAVEVGAPLLRERRHATALGGEVIEYSEDRYRSELISFAVTNTLDARPALSRSWSADTEEYDSAAL